MPIWKPGQKDYHQNELSSVQREIVQRIKPGSNVLEVGCASGFMTRYLHEKSCRVTCVEINSTQAREALPYCNKLITEDICNEETWNTIGIGFDYIVYADVLEHLVDPWSVLQYSRKSLKPDGTVLVSLPNVAYFTVRIKLLLGRFDYTPYGILDETHLRFFTAASTRRMFKECGFRIEEFIPINDSRRLKPALRMFPNVVAVQFVISASPACLLHNL